MVKVGTAGDRTPLTLERSVRDTTQFWSYQRLAYPPSSDPVYPLSLFFEGGGGDENIVCPTHIFFSSLLSPETTIYEYAFFAKL